jgi:hypothetical protein
MMNNSKYFTTSVVLHTIVILGLIFWPKSDKNPEIIQSMEMVHAEYSAIPLTPLEKSIPLSTANQVPENLPEIKPKAVLKETEEKVSIKEKKQVERKIIKRSPPPLPKIKSVLKSKLNNLMEDKPAPVPTPNKTNWIDPNEKKNWIEPAKVPPATPESSTSTDG